MTPKEFYKIYLRHPQICTDSRKVVPGCLFFALKGDLFDGNLFARAALEAGSSYAIVDRQDLGADTRFIVVENVLLFLQELAREHRSRLTIPIVALTGTNGKTTTKELISSVLKQQMNVVSTMGNLNNHIGVPLTLLATRPDTEILVVEMGANHPGEIGFLAEIAKPTHGLITNMGKAHLEGFGSFDGVVRAKGELFQFIRQSGGVWFQNADDPILDAMTKGYPSFKYGTAQVAQIKGFSKDSGLSLSANLSFPDGTMVTAESKLTGKYNLDNILVAAAIGFYFGLDVSNIRTGIESYTPSTMRSQWKQTGRNMILLDAYNANPSSMTLAIKHFHSIDVSSKVLILGDMFELGSQAPKEHAEIIHLVNELKFPRVYFAGKEFMHSSVEGTSLFFMGTGDLIEELKVNPVEGCTILIKGSRGMKLEEILDYL